ncbi:hormogonium polysaccharide biosynthesis protein HpsA [Calothrix sp. NIES-3974]|uniref:hormogonium polysaccharide biosynthesis protein HpsA n=1 Tax=Calothrix sp. NIES-3974 TaxID=2005462 RepID=UPI000B609E98|nr:hormogonium polysaccharide biosynthesis protein HpsA [Calothrix sp. NIES-3974]BAZ04380.1 hypothetical protein NIES3974_10180 [Calothrix sp. NIES-3974]
MSRNRRLFKKIPRTYRKLFRAIASAIHKQKIWLLRTLWVTKSPRKSANSGFVLPTVAMVSLVVVLLTVAILFRSFERSNNASNVRVNEAALSSAMPAIDRARAKIDKLFEDPRLPRSTPSDLALYNALAKGINKYTFGDETQLQIRFDVNENKKIDQPGSDTDLAKTEIIDTAWRYPVDTDNNGKFDSYTLYGIYFRSPGRDDKTGKLDRARNPLEARTPPMDDGSLGGICKSARGTAATLIGESGWYKSGTTLKKSFFVYVTTVPITENPSDPKFEQYKAGSKGFSAIEYQQDQERVPIPNNAVVYEDDLEVSPGGGLQINGRIFTNSNFQTTQQFNNDHVRFYQVSSPQSCFYEAENSKIIVGGNVGFGRITGTSRTGNVPIHLYKRDGVTIGTAHVISNANKSVNNTAGDIAYNTRAFAERLNKLVAVQMGTNRSDYSKDPIDVREAIQTRIQDNPGLNVEEVRQEELENYFKKRIIRVPFRRVSINQDGSADFAGLQDVGTDKLRAQDSWIYPFDANTGLTINPDKLPAIEPKKLQDVHKGDEQFVGDRVLVGNNLPALWFDKSLKDFVGRKATQLVKAGIKWDFTKENLDKSDEDRTRSTRIQDILSLSGATERDGFFEQKATETPKNKLDNVGGMRVVTGAGIFVDGSQSEGAFYPWDSSTDLDKSTPGNQNGSFFQPRPSLDTNFVGNEANKVKPDSLKFKNLDPIVVWPDTMPMTGGANVARDMKGDLLMRATAVYHYKLDDGIDQRPIACISSYYDPTDATTANNAPGLPSKAQSAKEFPYPAAPGGKSNNGVVYPPYSGTRAAAISKYSRQLERQARLVYPDGRFVNEPLRMALSKPANSKLSMSESSAIDTAVCAIEILNGQLTPNSSIIPHGAIYEQAFLDARQVKSVEQTTNVATLGKNPQYNRAIEERQPLEVRVTVLDMDELRKKTIGDNSEYLLPNSGIIYATRDDALLDLSDTPDRQTGEKTDAAVTARRKLISPTDYKLDPTRRPNGIMLVNGSRLDRQTNYRDEEKGLILATNVPAYIKGDFNLHIKGGDKSKPVEEFGEKLRQDDGSINWGKFYQRGQGKPNNDLDFDFACRPKDPRLPDCRTGDTWRPATVLADAVTVLSDNFRFGFRNEGDYDLRNNEGDIKSAEYRNQGFFDNNYVTSSDWYRTTGNIVVPRDFDGNPNNGNEQGSSYLNNFVTPIQRRVRFGEYLMEICTKIPVSSCTAEDWSLDGAGLKPTPENVVGKNYRLDTFRAGTTVELAKVDLQRYARRVAFLRNIDGNLILDNGQPVPLGIDGTNGTKIINAYTRNQQTTLGFATFGVPPATENAALWFRTTDKLDGLPGNNTKYAPQYHLYYMTKDGRPLTGTDPNEHPLLVPVLQLHVPQPELPGNLDRPFRELLGNNSRDDGRVNWFQNGYTTTTNVIIAGGDTPSRPTEFNGGLENFVRYLERWGKPDNGRLVPQNHSLAGSLIQYKRSQYATAPWEAILNDNSSIFGQDYSSGRSSGGYPLDLNRGRTSFYTPPSRQWGFDVGILSQLPDLFAQTFTLPPTTEPNEFFREVNRDDPWVKTLLCAKTADGKNNAISADQRPTEYCREKTE